MRTANIRPFYAKELVSLYYEFPNCNGNERGVDTRLQ